VETLFLEYFHKKLTNAHVAEKPQTTDVQLEWECVIKSLVLS